MKRLSVGAVAAVVAIAIGGAQANAGDAGKSGGKVRATNFEFTPKTVTVSAGSRVTWTAKEGEHTVTFKNGSDTVIAADGDAATSKKFKQPGTYRYFCRFHKDKGMKGKVVVK